MPVVSVRVQPREYDVRIEPGLIDRAGEFLRSLNVRSDKLCVVTDSNVAAAHADRFRTSAKAAGFECVTHVVPAGEAHKTLADAGQIFDTFLAAGVERQTPVVAVGGGVIGDMAGFVAATMLRGVPFVQVPTTLLAMVDASVGGKTAVDHVSGKNLIGAFYQPIGVLIDPSSLRTLPPAELRNGLAECIKHDVIRDAAHFAELERSIERALSLDEPYLSSLVAHNVAIKARIVEADPLERGERAHLNFGHTFGHAVELVSEFTVAHGEAVAVGMIAACRMAVMLGMSDDGDAARVSRLIERAGLPTRVSRLSIDSLVEALSRDKKKVAGKVRFVLPTAIGSVVVRDDVPEQVVRDAFAAVVGE
jgi:3-dehydroquinate synthase